VSFQILPIYRAPDGSDTGPTATTCATNADVDRELRRLFTRPRPGLRVVLSDDVTWRRVATYRVKGKKNG